MSIERKDVKPRFYPDDHERLRLISDHDGMSMNEWIEQLVLREIERRYAEARKISSLVSALEDVGKAGRSRESVGAPGTGGRR